MEQDRKYASFVIEKDQEDKMQDRIRQTTKQQNKREQKQQLEK